MSFDGDSQNEDTGRTLELTAENSAEDTPAGLARLLACCGILRTPAGQLSSIGENDRKYTEAVATLLRGKSTPVEKTYTHVQHIRQVSTWDCGIACLQMVLQWLHSIDAEICIEDVATGRDPIVDRTNLLDRVATQSIWTVDLVILLENLLKENGNTNDKPNRVNTSYLFCSEVWGVNIQHSTTGYYEKAFVSDSARVDMLCKEMSRLNLPVLCPYHLDFHQMINVISNPHCVAILLVDNQILMKEETGVDGDHDANQDAYMGHYVIVCGISMDPDHLVQAFSSDEVTSEAPIDPYCIALANPGISKPIMFVSPSKLERAWRADGTDCDVVFVAKHAS